MSSEDGAGLIAEPLDSHDGRLDREGCCVRPNTLSVGGVVCLLVAGEATSRRQA